MPRRRGAVLQPAMSPKKQKSEVRVSPRAAILDATARIMLEEGYAAVSSRKVAALAGITSQLLHYYFRTMDDLFIALFQRMEEEYDENFARALASDYPIRELWKLGMKPASTNLILEFNALTTHRKTIRALIARSARRDRSMHVAALSRILEERGHADDLPPTIVAVLMASLARTMVTETALGVSDGHAEMQAFIERYLSRLEPGGAPKGAPTRKKTRTRTAE
jgi:AcrR family transcriptional regulator